MQESICNAGDRSSIPGSGRSPGEGNGNPLQYSCFEIFFIYFEKSVHFHFHHLQCFDRQPFCIYCGKKICNTASSLVDVSLFRDSLFGPSFASKYRIAVIPPMNICFTNLRPTSYCSVIMPFCRDNNFSTQYQILRYSFVLVSAQLCSETNTIL